MLQLIKGNGVSQYLELLEQTGDEYMFQLYLDEDANRLYVAGKPIDSHIKVKYGSSEDYIPNLSYIFMDEAGNEVELNEVHITDIDDNYNMILRDTDTQTDAPNIYNGLMSVRDKFVLDCIAKALGVEISYEYYANVNHYSDYKNGDLEKMTDVDVYIDASTGDWIYAYDSFEYTVTNAAGGKEQIVAPAGTRVVENDVVRVKSIHFDYISDNINTIYDAGDLPADQTVPFKVGGIEAGTTVAELEKQTVSGVLTSMLFPVYQPEKVADASLEFGFVYDDEFTEMMEVGSEYPHLDNFYYKFTPETWKWKRPCECDGDVDTSCYVMNPEPEKVEFWFHDIDNECNAIKTFVDDPDDPSCCCNIVLVDSNDYIDAVTNSTTKHEKYVIKEDSSNYFTCVAYFTEGEHPADSEGNIYDASGNYFADVSSGKIQAMNPINAEDEDNWNKLYFRKTLRGAWRIYSNANVMSNESLWESKLVNPGEFEGNDAINIQDSEVYALDGQKFYVQWPNRTATDEHFYVYVPSHFEIVSANGAHDATPHEYSAKLTYSIDSSLNITNKLNMTREFNKYELSKQAGITTACVVVKKIEE